MMMKNPHAVALACIKSPARAAASRANGKKGGRAITLGSIRLDSPREGRGRILWLPSIGEIRVAASDQGWTTADDAHLGPQHTREEALAAIDAAWHRDEWDLQIRG
jgi:hypothetical protein